MVVALFHFLHAWNDFMGPLLYLTRKHTFTLAIALQSYASQHGGVQWHHLMAASAIVILPIIVLWLGFFDVSKITMVAFNTIFPIVTATIVGIMGVEKELIWSARNLGTTDRRLMWDVLLPAALPQILTGLQVALPIALIVCIITEMSMGGYGMGGAMIQASRMADSRGVFAGIIEISLVGWLFVKAMAMVRARLLFWHAQSVG